MDRELTRAGTLPSCGSLRRRRRSRGRFACTPGGGVCCAAASDPRYSDRAVTPGVPSRPLLVLRMTLGIGRFWRFGLCAAVGEWGEKNLSTVTSHRFSFPPVSAVL
ncbi:hypothetical protein NL676_007465 [Syzygium grande]|nr:hypothetical protein NL676_007465 [Syzygium grande]